MTPEHQSRLAAEADSQFERWLLDSARADTLPSGGSTEEAWTRLAAMAGALAATTSLAAEGSIWSRFARSTGVRWLLVGAVGGSALTLALYGWPRATPAAAVQATRSRPSFEPPSLPAPQRTRPALPAEKNASVGSEPAPREPKWRPKAAAVSEPAAVARSVASQTAERSSASTLAAEVLALDAVRSAIAAGTLTRAVRLIDQYHREFPEGQLAAEAEVLAIDALRRDGEAAETTRRAARFQEKYPNDPQAGRIESLATPAP